MKITIDISDDELKQLGWSWPPVELPRQNTSNVQWWPDGAYDYDPCKDCPNNPKNGGSGICGCTLPLQYGPNRITAASTGTGL